jgi:hypothetical protein
MVQLSSETETKITIPPIPKDWKQYSPIKIEPYVYPHCFVLRELTGSEYVVHVAHVQDEKWAYNNGYYTMDFEDAHRNLIQRSSDSPTFITNT